MKAIINIEEQNYILDIAHTRLTPIEIQNVIARYTKSSLYGYLNFKEYCEKVKPFGSSIIGVSIPEIEIVVSKIS